MNKLVLLLAMLFSLSMAIDECGKYTTCRTCLDIPPGKTEGGRQWCGWCHFPIGYRNGTEGKRCADQRDDPHHCNDLFDTYKCNVGWKCVDQAAGKCGPSTEGEGFGSNKTCQQYCQPIPPGPDKYQCNITTYTCEKCDPKHAEHCREDRQEACEHCEAPVGKLFKCDRSKPEAPNCKMCNSGDQGCAPHTQACKNCAPLPKLQKCNLTSMKCEKDPAGMLDKACEQNCGPITPVNLLGDWRGLMVKEMTKGQFVMGEFDMHFADKNMTFTWPNLTQQVFDVATSGYALRLTDSDGGIYDVINNEIASLKYTQAMGFATKGKGKGAPDSFIGAMKDSESTAWVFWKCKAGKKDQCDFSVMGEVVEELRDEPNDLDGCNKYPTCHTCITAKEGDVSCGWCQGGFLNYKDGGQTKFKCGGYKEGEPYKFTCPRMFKTEDCEGYNCDWNKLTCKFSEEGQFPDEKACKDICKNPEDNWQKCNTTSKKCETCKQGTAGCNTKAFCEASCNLTYAKCNDTIGKCNTCERGSDPNCTETKSVCDTGCKVIDHTKAVCNTKTGKCEECDPKHAGKGCIPKDQCKDQCKKNDSSDMYECLWQADPPKCKSSETGSYEKKECNDMCKVSQYAKCDYKNNKCVDCEVGKDPLCMFTRDYCKIMQERGKCKEQKLQGLFRMLMVQKGFLIGEFDINFDGEGKAAEQYVITEKNKKNLGHGKMEITKHEDSGESQVHFTEWTGSEMPELQDAWGVYMLKDGSAQVMTVLEFAVSKNEIQHLDDGLKQGNAYFVGVSCKDKDHCDFTKATPPMALTYASEYYEFLDQQFIQ